jgi:hypothetical protein
MPFRASSCPRIFPRFRSLLPMSETLAKL